MPSSWKRVLVAFLILLSANGSNASCSPGSYLTSTGTCQLCPIGFAQPLAGQSGCNQCPPTSFTPAEGASNCTPCPENQVAAPSRSSCECRPGYISGSQDANGNFGCEACPPGTSNQRLRSYFSYNICMPCSPNTFNSEPGQTMCQPCPEGQVSPERAVSCLACERGQEVVNGVCTTCEEGFTYDASEGKCKPCDPGFFKPAPGNYPCIPCPLYMSSNGSASECFSPCEDGKILMNDGSCQSCPPGHYYSTSDRGCRPCWGGSFMPHPNIRTGCYACAGDSGSSQGATSCTCRGEHLNNTCRVCDPLAATY